MCHHRDRRKGYIYIMAAAGALEWFDTFFWNRGGNREEWEE